MTNPILTPRTALEQCIILWTEIAERDVTRVHAKRELAEELFSYSPLYSCPCCEYAHQQEGSYEADMCNYCLIDEWRGLPRGCLDDQTSYARWCDALNPIDAKAGALAVAQLARDSLSKLEDSNE